MNKTLRKSIALLLVFILTVINYGVPIKSIAIDTIGLSSRLGQKKIDFKLYFDDENAGNSKEVNINDRVSITAEIKPKGNILLQDGSLNFKLNTGFKNNFKIVSIIDTDTNEEKVSNYIQSKNVPETTTVQEVTPNTDDRDEKDQVQDTIVNEVEVSEPVTDNEVEETKVMEVTVGDNRQFESEVVLESYTQDEDINTEKVKLDDITKPKKYRIILEYIQGKTTSLRDLSEGINVTLTGKAYDESLNSQDVSISKELKIIWTYNKDTELISNYTLVSPFSYNNEKGTFLQQEIEVKRDITNMKYLPLKQTKLFIEIPQIKNINASQITVGAKSLMATSGDQFAQSFTKDNWIYNPDTNTIEINVSNGNDGFAVNTCGSDNYIITYKYNEFVEENNLQIPNKVKLVAEEINGTGLNTQEKEVNTIQNMEVKEKNLVSVSSLPNDTMINKSSINANYYLKNKYKTEFKTSINVNIVAAEILENITIVGNDEVYQDINGKELNATNDVKYSGINFNYNEIKEMLENSGKIEVLNEDDEILYSLDKDTVKSEEESLINFENAINSIKIRFSSIKSGGNVRIEFIKCISKTQYNKETFNKIEKLKNTVKTEVKYIGSDITNLDPVVSETMLSKSISNVTLSSNQNKLSTTSVNDNIEMIVDLNNNTDTSDIFVNPEINIVFPKYIKNIDIQGISLLYENGLKIKKYELIPTQDSKVLSIVLEGVQEKFGKADVASSTKILVNMKMETENVTPKGNDSIKINYKNEAVTEYINQDKNTQQGYASITILYDSPNGVLAVNTIKNYDGKLSEISSAKQGIKETEITRNGKAQNATMKITLVNNTDNECNELTILGRFPFKGNKSIEDGEELGTNVTTKIKTPIIANESNELKAKIYYSNKELTNKDLNDKSNGWTEEIENMDNIKSYLIQIEGSLKPGSMINYEYLFEIPENLAYEAKIYGATTAYYNEVSNGTTVKKVGSADKVGLYTEVGPKVDAKLSVNIGNGTDVLEGKRLEYKLLVSNNGSIDLENVTAEIDISKFAEFQEKALADYYKGDYGFITLSGNRVVINIGSMKSGDKSEATFFLKAKNIPTLDEYIYNYLSSDDENRLNTKEVPEPIIATQAVIKSSTFEDEIKTEKIENKIKDANFASEISLDLDRVLTVEDKFNTKIEFKNNTNSTLKNVKAILHTGNSIAFENAEIDETSTKINNNEGNGIVYFEIGDLETNKTISINSKLVVKDFQDIAVNNEVYYELVADGLEPEVSTKVVKHLRKSGLQVSETNSLANGNVNEDEEFIISIKLKNIGEVSTEETTLYMNIPENINIISAEYYGENSFNKSYFIDDNTLKKETAYIEPGEEGTILIKMKSNNLGGNEESRVSFKPIIKNKHQNDIELDSINITVLNNKFTYDEEMEMHQQSILAKEQKKIEEDRKKVNSMQKIPESTEVEETRQIVEEPSMEFNKESFTDNEVKFAINGVIWEDANSNGVKEESEPKIKEVIVNLVDSESKSTLQSVKSLENGMYSFTNVPKGNYIVTYNLNSDLYSPTIYKRLDVPEEVNSDATITDSISKVVVTDQLIVDSDISNLDLGLTKKGTFNLKVNQYLSNASVEVNNNTKNYSFDSNKISKVEIDKSENDEAMVNLEYIVVLENTGNIDGYASNLALELDKSLEFIPEENDSWYLGTDNKLYTKDLDSLKIKSGEKKEVKLILKKKVEGKETGFISNKVEILDNNLENNSITHNTVITQKSSKVMLFSVSIGIAFIIGATYFIYKNKFKIKVYR